MKILITGSGGMVGRNIAESALLKEHALLTPRRSELDLSDFNATVHYLKRNKPDAIVHCAGRVGGIQANINHPVEFLVENLDMGRNIVLAARDTGIKKLLNMGSSCMYPRNAPNPLKEELILKGELEPTNEGYAIAKVAVAKLCEYVSRENPDFQYKTAIPCNLYGKYDKFDPEKSHMIPAVIRRLYQAVTAKLETIELWGDGTARREFMYVEDVADFVAYALIHFDKMPAYLNVGLGFDYSINDYYREIANIVGYSGRFTHDLTKPTGMKQKLVDVDRLKEFGWTAKTSLRNGLQKTFDYYLTHVR